MRAAGARIRLITDGDVAGRHLDRWPETGVDMLFGIGGTPEGVIAGRRAQVHGRRHAGPAVAPQRQGAQAARSTPASTSIACSSTDDLVGGDNCFFAATGVTDGDIVKGVRFSRNAATTESIVMRSRSGTVRVVDGMHDRSKLRTVGGYN